MEKEDGHHENLRLTRRGKAAKARAAQRKRRAAQRKRHEEDLVSLGGVARARTVDEPLPPNFTVVDLEKDK